MTVLDEHNFQDNLGGRMIEFYLNRLRKRLNENKNIQLYLDTTVPEELRDKVRSKWNEDHPHDQLK